jgi:hypothetical protein
MGKLNIKNIRYAGLHTGLKYYVGFSQKFTDKKLVDQFNTPFRNLHKRGIIPRNTIRIQDERRAIGVSGLLLSVCHCSKPQ